MARDAHAVTCSGPDVESDGVNKWHGKSLLQDDLGCGVVVVGGAKSDRGCRTGSCRRALVKAGNGSERIDPEIRCLGRGNEWYERV
jgi:hypothetical protein